MERDGAYNLDQHNVFSILNEASYKSKQNESQTIPIYSQSKKDDISSTSFIQRDSLLKPDIEPQFLEVIDEEGNEEDEVVERALIEPVLEEAVEEAVEEEEENLLDLSFCSDNYNNNINADLSKLSISKFKIDYETLNMLNIKSYYENYKPNETPCILKYEDKYLNIIDYISSGSFGIVLKYSEETPLPDEWIEKKYNNSTYYEKKDDSSVQSIIRPRIPGDKFIEVAIKTYIDKKDSEIPLIKSLQRENNIGFCNTLNAKILNYNEGWFSNKSIAVMDYMDGNLDNLIEKEILNINDAIQITYKIIESFNCLYEKGYSYTDLKSQNVLYKCYINKEKNGKIKIVLGDLGSLCMGHQTGVATYPPPESILNPTETSCNEKTMVWDIGVIFLELLGYDVEELFYHSGLNANLSRKNAIIEYRNYSYITDKTREDTTRKFIEYINEMLPHIIDIYNLNDYYNLSNTIKIGDILNNIFTNERTRLKLSELLRLFS